MTKADPPIDEVRRVRHAISLEVGHNLRQWKSTFAALEAQFKRPVIDDDASEHKAAQLAKSIVDVK
jgi:hypothetical protein